MKKEKSLEEMADELLEEYAHNRGCSLRDLGVLNQRRQERISRREIPMSTLQHKLRKGERRNEDDD